MCIRITSLEPLRCLFTIATELDGVSTLEDFRLFSNVSSSSFFSICTWDKKAADIGEWEHKNLYKIKHTSHLFQTKTKNDIATSRVLFSFSNFAIDLFNASTSSSDFVFSLLFNSTCNCFTSNFFSFNSLIMLLVSKDACLRKRTMLTSVERGILDTFTNKHICPIPKKIDARGWETTDRLASPQGFTRLLQASFQIA